MGWIRDPSFLQFTFTACEALTGGSCWQHVCLPFSGCFHTGHPLAHPFDERYGFVIGITASIFWHTERQPVTTPFNTDKTTAARRRHYGRRWSVKAINSSASSPPASTWAIQDSNRNIQVRTREGLRKFAVRSCVGSYGCLLHTDTCTVTTTEIASIGVVNAEKSFK